MTETTPTCQIHQKYSRIKCVNAAWPGDADGFCILHSQDKEKNQDDFKAALRSRWNQADQESYDFQGFFFPGRFDPRDLFGSGEFTKPVDFTGARFTEGANFTGARFTKGANFSEVSFTKGANFFWASFTKRAFFNGATFRAANFAGANFTDGANFSEASFTKGAHFQGARFKKGAYFSEAIFTEGAYFSEASFTERADFPRASFTKKADFPRATFAERADFFEATFAERANFSGARFRERANFSGAAIGGQVIFREINSPEELEPPPLFMADFRDLQFQEKGWLRFQDVSLAHCTFTGTDLRRPEFRHVTWGSLGGRQIIYNEAKLSEAEQKTPWFWDWFWAWISGHLALSAFALEIGHTADATGCYSIGTYLAEETAPPKPPWGDKYGEVERLYRNLKMNYIGEGDNKNAGDFHYGEMEMHRRASKWRWFPFYWNNLYRWLSGFGERPSRALGCLAGFLLALPLLVWVFCLDKVTGGTSPGFIETFTYIFEKATFQRPLRLSNLNLLGTFISNFSVLIIPGQAALFLLALRNRLGRRR